jgi:hypothetical protein
MDQADVSGVMSPQEIANLISQGLQEHDILAPVWVVEHLVDHHLASMQRSSSAAPRAVRRVDAETAEALIDAIVDDLMSNSRSESSVSTPALLDLDGAAQLLAALAIVMQCAAVNADRRPLALAATVSQAANCLIGMASAVREAGRAADPLLLLSDGTLDLARQALAGTLDELSSGRWVLMGDARRQEMMVALLRREMSQLTMSTAEDGPR